MECKTNRFIVPSNKTLAWTADLRFQQGIPGRFNIFPCSGSFTEWIEAQSQHKSVYLRSGLYGNIDYPGSIEIHENGERTTVTRGDEKEDILVARGFVGEYLDFLSAVQSGTPTLSNFRNAAHTQKVGDAIESGLAFCESAE